MHFRFFAAIRNKNPKEKNRRIKTCTLPHVVMEASSFNSFCDNNEVLDSDKQKVIKNRHRLFQIYKHGIDAERVFIINKN